MLKDYQYNYSFLQKLWFKYYVLVRIYVISSTEIFQAVWQQGSTPDVTGQDQQSLCEVQSQRPAGADEADPIPGLWGGG